MHIRMTYCTPPSDGGFLAFKIILIVYGASLANDILIVHSLVVYFQMFRHYLACCEQFGMLNRVPYNASVRCATYCEILSISRKDLDDLLVLYPSLQK